MSMLWGIFLILAAFVAGGGVIFLLALFVPDFIAKPDRYLKRMEKKLQSEATGASAAAQKAAIKALADVRSTLERVNIIKQP